MSETFASGSILYGRGPDGELRHIEDVERGEACNCVCPDPSCGQTLIARKGTKRAHHFAHKRGTCEWAVEYVVSAVAERVVREAGALVFPRLTYRNAINDDEEEELSQSRRMRITSARLVEESGPMGHGRAVKHAGGGAWAAAQQRCREQVAVAMARGAAENSTPR